jgi:hypothetical protein
MMPLHEFKTMRIIYKGEDYDKPVISEHDAAYLNVSNNRLLDLTRRYEGHPASAHTQWQAANLLSTLKLTSFRGDNHYIYQTRYSPTKETYYITAYYARNTDLLGIFPTLVEDGMYGAYALPFDDNHIISRDLLDSVNQINFISKMLEIDTSYNMTLLDIGAGYRRLGHRLAESFPHCRVTCADGVPISTFLSEYYLRYRGVSDRVEVMPLDEVKNSLAGRHFDVVTNIHSFSECQLSVIEWWLGIIDTLDARKLMIVPNARDKFLSTEPDGSHRDFSRLIGDHGWKLTHSEPIYAKSEVAQKYGLYPNFCFYWFSRG